MTKQKDLFISKNFQQVAEGGKTIILVNKKLLETHISFFFVDEMFLFQPV